MFVQMDKTHHAAEISEIRKLITQLSRRIDDLASPEGTATVDHPSQQRFNIAEAIADGVFNNMQKEKACTFEPNGKPCDHCSMCSSLGF